MMRTYLMRDDWDVRTAYPGGNVWQQIAYFVGRRETVMNLDPTRLGVFVLLARQANCNVSNKVVTLPYGIVVPEVGNPLNYVQAFGTVNEQRVPLTVTAVNESAGTITISETTDAGTKVDVYCVPRVPLLVELRIEPPESGVKLQRTLWVADVSSLVERDWWKAGLVFPAGLPIPEDWMLSLWVRCALPIDWVESTTNTEIRHRLAIPVVITPQPGLQDALKASLYSELTQ